jgi:hypothetical protein
VEFVAADDKFNQAKAAEKLVLNWLADPFLAVSHPIDACEASFGRNQLKFTCARDHDGYCEETLPEPDLESFVKCLPSLRACRGLVSTPSDANSMFVQQVVRNVRRWCDWFECTRVCEVQAVLNCVWCNSHC